MKPNKELQKAFERKKELADVVYIWLAEVAFITILLSVLLRQDNMDAREFKGIIYNTLSDHNCRDQEDVWLTIGMIVDLCRDAGDDYCNDRGIEFVDWSETV